MARPKKSRLQEDQADRTSRHEREFQICWSARRVLSHLPEAVEAKKTVLHIVDRLLRYEHGDAWNKAVA